MRRELSRYQNVTVEGEKREVEKLRRERDFLKREVEELRSKMMESRETAQFYRTTLQDLEQRVLKANASLAISTGRTGFSTTGIFLSFSTLTLMYSDNVKIAISA